LPIAHKPKRADVWKYEDGLKAEAPQKRGFNGVMQSPDHMTAPWGGLRRGLSVRIRTADQVYMCFKRPFVKDSQVLREGG